MKKMNLVFDIGNTHIVGGLYLSEKQFCCWRWHTDKAKTEDEYYLMFKGILQQYNISTDLIQQIALGSVVPNLTRTFEHLFQKYLNSSFYILNAYTDLGLKFPVDNPGFIGADLIINAFAAKEKYKKNCIICDLGTATTIQLVSADGFFHGTVIAPGLLISSRNLFEKASQLATIELKAPKYVLGKNTPDAVCSGIINGNAYMIDGFIQQIRLEHPELTPIYSIATGGMATMIASVSSYIDCVDKNLTLEGLNLFCMRNN